MSGTRKQTCSISADGDVEVFVEKTVQPKAAWDNAYNREGNSADRDRPADDARIAGKVIAPEGVGQHHHSLARFRRMKHTSDFWLHSQYVEKVRRDSQTHANCGDLSQAAADRQQNLALRDSARERPRAA